MNRLPRFMISVGLLLLSALPAFSQFPDPIARPWQFQSFFDDANLAEKYVISLDCAQDGSVWLAVSDGLYHFDGYRWSRYTTEHGLPSNFVRSVLVTSDGTLWIGTDQGAGTFDNGRFDFHGTSGNLGGPSVRRIVEDPDGALWFCCDQWPDGDAAGGLTRMQDGRFTTWRHSDGLPSDYVSDYFRDSHGRQFVLTNKGLAQFSKEGFRRPLKDAGLWDVDEYVWSLVESEQHGLIAATDTHFYQLNGDHWRRIANSVETLAQPKLVATDDGEIYTCTSGRGPYIHRWTGDGFVPVSKRLVGIVGGVEMLVEDSMGAIWIGGFERLMRWERSNPEWVVYGGVGAPRFKDSAAGVWFDAPEDGLIRFHGEQWTAIPGLSAPIMEDRVGNVWAQSANGPAIWSDGQLTSPGVPTDLLRPQLIGVDGQGTVWAHGSNATGLPVLAGFDGNQWNMTELSQFAVHNTVRRVYPDPTSGTWVILGTNAKHSFRLLHVDATSMKEVPLPITAQLNDPPRVHTQKDGTLMIGGLFGLLQRSDDDDSWADIELPSRAVSQIVDLNGATWISCRGHLGGQAALVRYRDGIWEPLLDRQGVIVGRDGEREFYASSHGLIHIVAAGLDRLLPPLWTPFETRATSVVAGHLGEYWVGVGNRLYRYTPHEFPPETEIVAANRNLNEDDEFVLRVRGLERFKPTRMKREFSVSIQLDDSAWTPFEPLTSEIRVPQLVLGNHSVRVRVQDAAGQIDATPATFQFHVSPIPLQLRPWFKPAVWVCFLAMLCLAFLAARNWVKLRRAARGLKREVARQTSRLSASERKYRMLFEDSQDAICLFGIDGALQSCNRVASALLGMSVEQHRCISDVLADVDNESRFKDELLRNGRLRGRRFRVRKQNGDVFDAILSVNTRTEEDQFIGYQVIIRDVSDLVQLQNRLLETEKMEAVGLMAGGIAHDFNNFLAVVMYGADFVKLKAKENPDIEKGVQMIVDAAQRGKNLTSQIQTFSRAPAIDLVIIDTHKVLTGIPFLLQGIAPQNVELTLELDDDLGLINADPQQLEIVVINLVVNACHAMQGGGSVRVRAVNTHLDGQRADELQLECSGPYVQIDVSDTGEGMDAATRARIFDPFFTTKPQGQGTGLGLAIVYGIIRQFSGRIYVNSTPGEGTCFEMYFPIRSGQVMVEPTEPRAGDPVGGTETILLVEDEENIRKLAKASLERYGYSVHVAEDVSSAQTHVESNDHIDLVISDVVMAGASGFDLARWLLVNRRDVAILLISGYPNASDNGALGNMNLPFLKKPFHPAELAARVREILDAKITLKA